MTTKEIEQAFDISNMLPNRVLKDDAEILQFIKHCVGISKAFTESFTIDESVIEDIKTEIRALPKTYPFVNHLHTYVKDDDVLAIIDKHCGGDADNHTCRNWDATYDICICDERIRFCPDNDDCDYFSGGDEE